jgi:hypothetical protein
MIGNAVAGIYGIGVAPVLTAYESIATTTVGSGGTSTITFSSIPATYTHLQLRIIARTNRGSARDYFRLRFNADTTSNYSYHNLSGNGSSATSTASAPDVAIDSGLAATTAQASNIFGVSIYDILDYANTNKYKTTRNLAGVDSNDTNGKISLESGSWRSTSAVSTITLISGTGSDFLQYSSFALYGIKGA